MPKIVADQQGDDTGSQCANNTPRFLVWRSDHQRVELAITETPESGWQAFGPFGSGILYLRTALARLLWFAVNPAIGSIALPAGWVHGRLGEIVTVRDVQNNEGNSRTIEIVLRELFAGDHDGFIAWVGEQTKLLTHAHDLAMRDADLKTVIQFMQAKAHRTRPFSVPDSSAVSKRTKQNSPMLFPCENGTPP